MTAVWIEEGRYGSAVFSSDVAVGRVKQYRHRLDRRHINKKGPVYCYVACNPSKAGGEENDNSVTKLEEFTRRFGGSRFVLVNGVDRIATDVRELGNYPFDFSTCRLHGMFLQGLHEADVVVPCWGRLSKVPKPYREAFSTALQSIMATDKSVRCFGLTKDGDPVHPLMLPYSTELVDYREARIVFDGYATQRLRKAR